VPGTCVGQNAAQAPSRARDAVPGAAIRVRGARQNNLKNLDLDLPLCELIVVTGVSGSGKSSLAFDTIYSEGQRRYVETFSPYARQFLDRMDKPQVDRIDGIPPAIAIDQTNPVRTSRSTVGTMTELNDHLKLLFARVTALHCRACGRAVRRETSESIATQLLRDPRAAGARGLVTFTVRVPENFTEGEVTALLAREGYTRIHTRAADQLEVVQDRLRFSVDVRDRLVEGLDAALKHGRGRVTIHVLDESGTVAHTQRHSSDLHCAECDLAYQDPVPSLFSFNSPIGACETCRGFGRTLGIDYGLVVPDESKTLADGAIRPWQSQSYDECQRDLMRYARKRGVPTDVPWRQLSPEQREWVLEGEGGWDDKVWYGARRFFAWLESRSYKMHIRVLLSKYRSYTPCPVCHGARLKDDALLWRLGSKADADAVLAPEARFRPSGASYPDDTLRALPGLSVHDVMCLPLARCLAFCERLELPPPFDAAAELLVDEIRTRLRYLNDVGLGYLTLDRQSRTLSGGEVQRINLTTALGTSLVNTLFVLDEPSIGLHARDIARLVRVLHRLRDSGNSLLVVEHDRELMLAADRILDLGPGPGERGGHLVFEGAPSALLEARDSLTASYLRGEREVARSYAPARRVQGAGEITLSGAHANNLKGVDVAIPLNRLVCITGVSGSGKSTLLHDVLYRALCKARGRPVEAPGAHRALGGHDAIADVVLVDQTPIGKTTRSNPASYIGAFDCIRKLFAAEPLARERRYTTGTFSFNAGNGRCPTCGGNGFEHVEMQFLSDVYLRCADCDGRRYRPEVLEVVRLAPDGHAYSIADVLEMSAARALEVFAEHADVRAALAPLVEVGLGYLRLGQPVPTLSGGEAQRLKLAGHLAEAKRSRRAGGKLFLFDEPTTGLHFDDIATLLGAFARLVEQGHSLLVIEHNLEVIAAADWVIDLGPEGGDAGGEVVCAGTPEAIVACERSHTGVALRERASPVPMRRVVPARAVRVADAANDDAIRIHNAREHNLKNVDIRVPRDRMTVLTGVSGSGKSTVAFDILFAEGQRRYLESLNAYARQFVQPAGRPDVDAIFGIPPTVAIEQRTSRGGRKSTVATVTELYHFLRLLYVKLGVQHCPDCDHAIEPQTAEAVRARILREYRNQHVKLLAPLVVARKGYYTDLAKWAAAKGFATLRVDGVDTPTSPWPRLDRFREHDIDLAVGEVAVSPANEHALGELLARTLEIGRGMARVAGREERLYSTRRACPQCGRSFPELDPRLFSFNSKHGWCEECFGTGILMQGFDEQQTGEEIWWTDYWASWTGGEIRVCESCHGQRLRPEALAVRFEGRTIAALTAMSVAAAEEFFGELRLSGRSAEIARDVLAELRTRLAFLREVGLPYLALDRAAPTLSGGEAQRLRLASQLGSNLRGVCYILDEPSIGLHARDNKLLLDTLARLSAKGNTLVVVEHDEETIRRAEHVIDLGPGAGTRGGEVVATGTPAEIARNGASVTGRFLAEPLRHPFMPRRGPGKQHVAIEGAKLHNLKRIDVRIPLQRLVCVTGVSGSGKSTLVRDLLHDNVHALLSRKRRVQPRGCKAIEGWEQVKRVLEVDQTPIGKTPRSCPATYVGFWDDVRKLYAQLPEARLRGYGPGRFSFNVAGGRCEACEGQGVRTIEMSFMPDVRVPCEVCGGGRFGQETLGVRFKDRSVADLLAMSVDEAAPLFAAQPRIHRALALLQDVGLGYLTLGQQSPTLSGGEAQRIKLVTELARAASEAANGGTLYVLDEPTIGLHMADVEKLIRVLHRLVEAGHSVVIIEHNLDVIAEADWIIDLGPEGGDGGGRIVAHGTPEVVAKRSTHTAQVLAPFLRERSAA
jgi:excinuclease ABC subunit A